MLRDDAIRELRQTLETLKDVKRDGLTISTGDNAAYACLTEAQAKIREAINHLVVQG